MIAAVRRDTRAPKLTVEMSVAIDWGKNGAETSIILLVLLGVKLWL